MKFIVPDGALHILEKLNKAGHQAYLVGGCVRDMLRGVEPHDWDICTSALPWQVEERFSGRRIIETGLAHGTVTIMDAGEAYEVTTYRLDGKYTDGRRPDSVEFVSELREDLARRDFTMNAIAADWSGNIIDPFGGAEDIRGGIVRCVGEPGTRFREDGLRIMRALRFSSVLGFKIDSRTAESIHENREMLRRVAAERINVELRKLLVGRDAGAILREYLDVFCVFWPELGTMAGVQQLNPWHLYDVWEHTVRTVEAAPADVVLRLAMLLHDIGKPQCRTIDENGVGHFRGHQAISAKMADEMLRRLKSDNSTREQVTALVSIHDVGLAPQYNAVRRIMSRLGEKLFFMLLDVKQADRMGQNPTKALASLERLREVRSIAGEIIKSNQCLSLKDLAVNGRDVIEAGAAPGPEVGEILARLMDTVLDGALPNERDALLEGVRKIKEDT